jgi:hydrogenase expression/formation protein HypC
MWGRSASDLLSQVIGGKRAPLHSQSRPPLLQEHNMCLAIPGKIVEVLEGTPTLGTVEVAGVRRKVDLGLLQDDMPKAGDWVLIHVGFAMSKISEQDALDQMQTLAMLGEAEQAMQEVRGYGLEDTEADSTTWRKPN